MQGQTNFFPSLIMEKEIDKLLSNAQACMGQRRHKFKSIVKRFRLCRVILPRKIDVRAKNRLPSSVCIRE